MWEFWEWNEVTKYFRAGMPMKKHRLHFKTYGNCFTASEAIDWLHHLLKKNNNFGTDVTRQQTIQLLRKFLKNHVIEDIKGRWGTEDLDDNHNIYRFPSTSPVKPLPSRHPLWKRSSLENVFKDKDNLFKIPNFSRRSSKTLDSKDDQENEVGELEQEFGNPSCPKELSKRDIEDIWGNITLIHLQKILALPSLDDLLNPAQINPGHIMYNMTHTSKHGVVVLEDKTGDLPHWVLSAMKCLANWPRNNDMSQATYVGFERDVFRTVADYFLGLSEPLLTFEYYELFVNILVVCGYLAVPNRLKEKQKLQRKVSGQQQAKPLHANDANFKSTECLLLSLLRKVPNEDEEDADDQSFGEIAREHKDVAKVHRSNTLYKKHRDSRLVGGSCQNLSISRNDLYALRKIRVRSCSMEPILDLESEVNGQSSPGVTSTPSKAESMLTLPSDLAAPSPPAARTAFNESRGTSGSKWFSRSHSMGDGLGSCSSINAPVAEITVRPGQYRTQKRVPSLAASMDTGITVTKRLCQSSVELSDCSLSSDSPQNCPGTQRNGLLQPHLEKVAMEALQLCCLLLPPANRRKLQLLMRMISRMSQNVDMPRLHDAMGTRSLMIQTFSRCVLCCAEEVDLDELLATRLVSFLLDHHQDVLKVPCYLQTAVQDHVQYLHRAHVKVSDSVPTYYFCKQISKQEFEAQKFTNSQAAIEELLESIIKDRHLSVKDKKKKLKQFQKEYPAIYRSRFPTTESEAKLFEDKPTIKQPILVLKRPKFRSLRH
uniref:DEP domain containing 1 n=1 Tax=Leptobrachium leishanense TaxID=445787 RepID=A0A8C5QQ91_9ANUR